MKWLAYKLGCKWMIQSFMFTVRYLRVFKIIKLSTFQSLKLNFHFVIYERLFAIVAHLTVNQQKIRFYLLSHPPFIIY